MADAPTRRRSPGASRGRVASFWARLEGASRRCGPSGLDLGTSVKPGGFISTICTSVSELCSLLPSHRQTNVK